MRRDFELHAYELLHSRNLLDWTVRTMTRAEKSRFPQTNAVCVYDWKSILYCPWYSRGWIESETVRIAAHEVAHALGYRGHGPDHAFMTWKLKRQLR